MLDADTNGKGVKDFVLDYEFGTSIPSDNLTITTIGESCDGKNNGQVQITAAVTKNYKAQINGSTYDFTSVLNIDNLTPGMYDMCVTADNGAYEQCFRVNIAESLPLAAQVNVMHKAATISVQQGTAPYLVYNNGVLVLQTNDKQFTVDVKPGDALKIKTSADCQGEIDRIIPRAVTAYPNPTEGRFKLSIPTEITHIRVDLLSVNSQVLSSATYTVNNAELDYSIETLPRGVYFLKVYSDQVNLIKVVKK